MRLAKIVTDTENVELQDGLIVNTSQNEPEDSILASQNETFLSKSQVPVRKFTVDEYHRLIDAGILREGEPVELLCGWMVTKMTRNPPHDASLTLAFQTLSALVPEGWHCRVQAAITTRDSEPEPDVAIVRGKARDYKARHPQPHEVGLLIEVADTSLVEDRLFKDPLYACSKIAVYWIVNIPDSRIEVYTNPGDEASSTYLQRRDYSILEQVPFVLDDVEVAPVQVRDLLP